MYATTTNASSMDAGSALVATVQAPGPCWPAQAGLAGSGGVDPGAIAKVAGWPDLDRATTFASRIVMVRPWAKYGNLAAARS